MQEIKSATANDKRFVRLYETLEPEDLVQALRQFDDFVVTRRNLKRLSRWAYLQAVSRLGRRTNRNSPSGVTPIAENFLEGQNLSTVKSWEVKDFMALRDKIESAYSGVTSRNMILSMRFFFKWYLWHDDPNKAPYLEDRRVREVPGQIRFFRSSTSQSKETQNRLDSQVSLNPGQIMKLVQVQTSDRDKALVLLAYESGGRIEEVLNMRIKDFKKKPDGCYAYFRISKTQPREVPLKDSVELVENWLDSRKKVGKLDPESPLWLTRSGRALTYASWREKFTDRVERVQKEYEDFPQNGEKITSHTLRHSRATYLANIGWSEQMLRKMFGWGKTSSMPSYYVNRKALDLRAALDRAEGREPVKVEMNPFETVKCPDCGFEAFPGSRFCASCGLPLTETGRQAEKEVDETVKMVNALVDLIGRDKVQAHMKAKADQK